MTRLNEYRYFIGCTSLIHVKEKYRELVKYYHPDKVTGSHESFTALQNEYEWISNSNITYPISNVLHHTQMDNSIIYSKTQKETYKEQATNLNPEELIKEKAINYFNTLRQTDHLFDFIDSIITQSKKDNLSKLWLYQEVSKIWDLNIDHFKYITFKCNDKVAIANELFKKYQSINV